jgi:quinol-cytochrome oxidoreductase complex cytochrome b subunit
MSVIVALAGVLFAAKPNVPIIHAINSAWPQVQDALPYILTGGGALYAAACRAPQWLRRTLFKPHTLATPVVTALLPSSSSVEK